MASRELVTSMRLVHSIGCALMLSACGGGPQAVADWRMLDRTVDAETDQRGEGDAETPGADGVADD